MASITTLSRSLRTFTTTAKRSEQPVPLPTAAQLFASVSGPSSSSSSRDAQQTPRPASTADAMRAMLNALAKTRAKPESDGRKKFHPSSVITPSDLRKSSMERGKTFYPKSPLFGPPKRLAKEADPFHITKSSPLDHSLNPNFICTFLDPLGNVRPRSETGLTQKSQRRVTKLVRRARSMGVITTLVGAPARFGLGTRPAGDWR